MSAATKKAPEAPFLQVVVSPERLPPL